MKIAVPTAGGMLCMHFGHCEVFTLMDVDPETKTIKETVELVPPPHEPGVLPVWLGEQGANLIIAGGMGGRAQSLFEGQGVQVVVGAPGCLTPADAALAYLNGSLTTGANACDH